MAALNHRFLNCCERMKKIALYFCHSSFPVLSRALSMLALSLVCVLIKQSNKCYEEFSIMAEFYSPAERIGSHDSEQMQFHL